MLFSIKTAAGRHMEQHKVRYTFMVLCLITGIVAGILFVGTISDVQSKELNDFIQSFCNQTAENSFSPTDIFYTSILGNLRILSLIWLCGLLFVISPLAYGVIIVKGFSIGFTAGYFSIHYGFKGFMLAMVAVFPQGIFLIPALFYMVLCVSQHALKMKVSKKGNGAVKSDGLREFRRFTYCILAGGLLLLLSSLVDAFIVPVFVKSICGLMIG